MDEELRAERDGYVAIFGVLADPYDLLRARDHDDIVGHDVVSAGLLSESERGGSPQSPARNDVV